MSKDIIIIERLKNVIYDYIRWLFTLGKFAEGRKIQEALDNNDLDALFESVGRSQGNSDQDKIIVSSLIFSIQACNSLYQIKRNLDCQEKNQNG